MRGVGPGTEFHHWIVSLPLGQAQVTPEKTTKESPFRERGFPHGDEVPFSQGDPDAAVGPSGCSSAHLTAAASTGAEQLRPGLPGCNPLQALLRATPPEHSGTYFGVGVHAVAP